MMGLHCVEMKRFKLWRYGTVSLNVTWVSV
jgi:hypothetical protein